MRFPEPIWIALSMPGQLLVSCPLPVACGLTELPAHRQAKASLQHAARTAAAPTAGSSSAREPAPCSALPCRSGAACRPQTSAPQWTCPSSGCSLRSAQGCRVPSWLCCILAPHRLHLALHAHDLREQSAPVCHSCQQTRKQRMATGLDCLSVSWELAQPLPKLPSDKLLGQTSLVRTSSCINSQLQPEDATAAQGSSAHVLSAGCSVGSTAPPCPLPACCSASRSATLQRLPALPAPRAQVTSAMEPPVDTF